MGVEFEHVTAQRTPIEGFRHVKGKVDMNGPDCDLLTLFLSLIEEVRCRIIATNTDYRAVNVNGIA